MLEHVLFSSVAGINPNKNALFYTISKAALDMATKQFAFELGPHQIRVNSVCPTLTLTEYVTESPDYVEVQKSFLSGTPMGRLPTCVEIVRPIMYLLSDESSMVSGTLHVVGAYANIEISLYVFDIKWMYVCMYKVYSFVSH